MTNIEAVVSRRPMIPVQQDAAGDHRAAAEGGGHAAALGVADFLCLAAAPTFAATALLTGVANAGAPGVLCSATHGPLGGMVPMYWLMSVFHLTPWLRLISRRRGDGRRSIRRTALPMPWPAKQAVWQLKS